jgi:exosortase H (IPTLxxWG-CTERM-specific)
MSEAVTPSATDATAEVQPLPKLWGFFARFLIIQLVLFTVEILKVVQANVIEPFTSLLAWFSFQLMSLFDSTIVAQGIVIRNRETGFGIEVVAGCNGVEATIIILAAVLAFRAPLSYKLWGIGLGFLAIHALNIVRIISLFYIGQWNIHAYEWAHLYIWQALILLDAIIVWLVWIRKLPRTTPQIASEKMTTP